MKQNKLLRWASLFIVSFALVVAILAPSPHALAQSTPPNQSGQTQTTCEASGFSLNWVLCPVFNAVSDAAHYFITNIVVGFLKVPPVSTDPAQASFQTWSSFRVYGDIILVIATIVVVFGQAIGGGVIDAYTAKKILPRILVAAILINLSVYIVAFLVDFTNILGNGVADLIIAPFKGNGDFNFSLKAGQQFGVFALGFFGLFLAGGAVAGTILALFAGFGTVVMAALFALIPVILAVVAIFFTLVFRQGLILFLVMVSPLAFALYCLPNTENLFKKWWDLLIEALLVYPIVLLIFAVADVLSITVMQANNITPQGFTQNTLAAIIAFFMQFAPLFLIPFAFRMAGGTLSKAHELVTKGSTAINNLSQARGQRAKQRYQNLATRQRAELYGKINTSASRVKTDAAGNPILGRDGKPIGRSRVSKWALGQVAGRIGGYNMDEAIALQNAEALKEFDSIKSTGRDAELRALTVDKAKSRSRVGENGTKQYQTLGGAWVDEADVDRAQGRWKGNNSMFQAALSYEMQKASTQEQIEGLVNNYGTIVKELGFSDQEAQSSWTGAAFGNQNSNVEYKHYSWKPQPGGGSQLELNGNALMSEIDEKRGTWQMSQQSADSWTAMSWAVLDARQKLQSTPVSADPNSDYAKAQNTLERAARIARTYTMRGQGGFAVGEDGEQIGVRVGGGGGGGNVAAATGAAGRVQEEIDNFVKIAQPDVVRHEPPTYYDPDTRETLPAEGPTQPDTPGTYNPQQSTPRNRRGGI